MPAPAPLPPRDPTAMPVNPIAPVVIILVLAIAGVEAVLSLAAAGLLGGQAGIGWRHAAIGDWAFSPAVWDLVTDQGNRDWPVMRRFLTYGLVHGSFTHALFGAALLLALGKFVGDIFHWAAVLAIVVAGLVAGAVVFGVILDGPRPLFGCYPAVYALIGAFTYVLWLRLGRQGENQLRAFRLIGMLMALQLLFGLIFGAEPSWIADLAGFVAGLAVSIPLSPGGLSALRDRLRAR